MPIIVMLDKDTWATSEDARILTVPQGDLDEGKTDKYEEQGMTVQELVDFVYQMKEMTDEMVESGKT